MRRSCVFATAVPGFILLKSKEKNAMEEIRVADRQELWKCPANQDIADALERIADLMEAQGADRFRVNAYRRAGRSIGNRKEDIAELVLSEKDRLGKNLRLEDIPHIGKKTASLVREFVRSGRIGLLERLEGEIAPENLFRSVPGVGDELARLIISDSTFMIFDSSFRQRLATA